MRELQEMGMLMLGDERYRYFWAGALRKGKFRIVLMLNKGGGLFVFGNWKNWILFSMIFRGDF